MTITVTALTSVSGSGTAAQTRASSAFTPTANSRVVICCTFFYDGGTNIADPGISTTITGWTTSPVRTGFSTRLAIGFEPFFTVFEGVMGASPTSGTVTIDFNVSTADAYYSAFQVFDLTGTTAIPTHKQTMAGPQVVNNAGGSSETHTTAALGVAATTGNTSIVSFGASNDTPAAAPATPSGWATVGTPTVSTPTAIGIYSRTDFTGTTVTCTDLGEVVDTSGSVLFEFEEAGGAPTTTTGYRQPPAFGPGAPAGRTWFRWARILGVTEQVAAGVDATATPAAIVIPVAMPAATPLAGSTVVPAVTALAATLPQATPQAGATTTPAATVLAVTLGAATPLAGSTATPAAITIPVTIGAAAASGGGSASAAPAAITIPVTIPAATPLAGTTTTPAAITIPVTMPAATPQGGGTRTPAATVLTVTLPAVTPQAGATVAPAVIPLTVTIPAASTSGASTGTATPAAITIPVTMPAAIPLAGTTVTPAATVLTVTMPAAIPTASRTTSPAVIPLVVAIGSVTATGATASTATPNAIALVTVTPTPTLVYGYVVNPQAIALAISIGAAVAQGLQPDAHPITVTLRDAGHTITVQVTATTATIADTGHTATVISTGRTATVEADASATVREQQ